jgi:WD40 repeat protein
LETLLTPVILLYHPPASATLTGVRPFAVLDTHEVPLAALAFSPVDQILASGSRTATVTLWDMSQSPPGVVGKITAIPNGIQSMRFSPKGHVLAVTDDHSTSLWSVADPAHPTHLATLTQHSSYVTSVAFNAQGTLLVTGSQDDTIEVWNVSDPAHPHRTAVGNAGAEVDAVAFSSTGNLLATSGSQGVALWSLDGASRLRTAGTINIPDTSTIALEFLANADTLVVGGSANYSTASLWDVNDPTHPSMLSEIHGTSALLFTAIAIRPDNEELATVNFEASVAQLWDISDPQHPRAIGSRGGDPQDSVSAVAFDPTGTILATGESKGTIGLWALG